MYKIHYPEIPNMGDLLNKYMLEDLFGISVKSVSTIKSNISAIGSGLDGTLISNNSKTRLKQMIYRPFMEHDHHIWGTGFIKYANGSDNAFIYKNVVVHSLRGKLTQRRVEEILGKKLNVPLGDGGLLAERWVGPVDKKYQIGIIPHFKEKKHEIIAIMCDYYKNSTVIDLSKDPREVIKNIAECEVIISSSLHGLIVADSYHIPNMHIQFYPFGEKAMGDGYKFSDYYSAFDLKDNIFDVSCGEFPEINQILKSYCLDADLIEKRKKEIFDVFPKLDRESHS